MTEQLKTGLATKMEREISDFLTKPVSVGGETYSQAKLVRRIGLFENHIYPLGKFDKQGNYKYWFDIIGPRIDAEIKNIDFDTKDITCYSPRKSDEVPNLILNLKMKEWLRETGQADKINTAIEEGAGWGNIVWKKVKGTYERVDLRNFYVINQAAESLDQSSAIERHQLTQSELRSRGNQWKNVADVIRSCGQNIYKSTVETMQQEITVPMYSIYERNGEVSWKDIKEFKGEKLREGDENRFTYAKVISAGTEGTSGGVQIKYIMFAEEAKMPYKEYHRGRYKGKWFREGLYEILFDVQVRGNEIGNQLAQGLQYASKTIYRSSDKLIVQNILTDLKNGDIVRSQDLQEIPVRMQGFDQLANEWNRILELANELANSREVVMGGDTPAGMPFRLGAMLNTNANKLFDFIREKLSIPFREMFEEWLVPELIKEITAEEVIRLTGDSDMLRRMHEMLVEDWYVHNLIAIGPHGPDVALALKEQKMGELENKTLFLKEFKNAFKNYKPHVSVVITGENSTKDEELQTLATFIGLEADPVRRSYLVERAMKRAGIDVGALPRQDPAAMAGRIAGTPAPAPTTPTRRLEQEANA